MGVIGVNSHAKLGDCKSGQGAEITSILDWAQKSGKATGLISTARITHATPAATYAHSPDRDWENDADIPKADRNMCVDIAKQLITSQVGRRLKVVLGGGRRSFLPKEKKGGKREDGLDLLKLWKDQKKADGFDKTSFVIQEREQLESLDLSKTDYLLGLFSKSHMEFEYLRNKTQPDEPSLTQMVQAAIQILQKDPNGFHLVVEGGRIDHAHHDGMARLALHDLVEFDNAIEMALSMVPEEESLFVVTADHSHTLSMVGYPTRGNPILKFADSDADDGLPYTTLSYANGPGAVHVSMPRRNLTNVNTEHHDFKQDAYVPLGSESHGGEDVAIYAKGPFAHLFHGLHEQHYIAHAIDYAACYRKKDGAHCYEQQKMEMMPRRNPKYRFLNDHHH